MARFIVPIVSFLVDNIYLSPWVKHAIHKRLFPSPFGMTANATMLSLPADLLLVTGLLRRVRALRHKLLPTRHSNLAAPRAFALCILLFVFFKTWPPNLHGKRW